MHFVAIGLQVGRAPLAVRERLAFAGERLAAGLAVLRAEAAGDEAEVQEAVIVSTCHRLELVAVAREAEAGERALVRFLAGVRDVPADDFLPYLTCWHDGAAIEHVFALAAGLDSPVLGDSQILGQVGDAYEAARAAGASGPLLGALFQHATRAGKRVHSETTLNRHASVGYTAAALALDAVGGGADRRVLVIGAGKMGQWAADYLHRHATSHILIANRRLPHAASLAERVNGIAVPWEEREEALVCADVVISTTAAPSPILTKADIERVMARRGGRALHLVDIALPRDIAPDVREVPGVTLTTVDDLSAYAASQSGERAAAVPLAAAIIEGEVAQFREWMHARAVSPTISEIRAAAEAIRGRELARFFAHSHDLTEREAKQIDALTRAIVNKLLHQPTVRLKATSGGAKGLEYAEVARDLFGLLSCPYLEGATSVEQPAANVIAAVSDAPPEACPAHGAAGRELVGSTR